MWLMANFFKSFQVHSYADHSYSTTVLYTYVSVLWIC